MSEPLAPTSPVAQTTQTETVSDVRDGVTLSRVDGKRDVVPVEFPTVPDRFRVGAAYRYALGFREGDAKGEPSGIYNAGDAKACGWAALGLCWRGKDIALPNFREQSRDVVAYGEQVMSALWFAGYREGQEQVDAGLELIEAFMVECYGAEARATADFQKARRRG